MNNSTHYNTEILIQYLDGELDQAERVNIEKQISSDPKLANELENLRLAREAVNLYGTREKVKSLHLEMMQELDPGLKLRSDRKNVLRYSLGIAAGILLIAGLFIVYNMLTLSGEKVFASAYRTYELPTFRDSVSGTITPMEKAFRMGDYSKVVNIPVQGNFTVEEHFLRGISYLEIRDNHAAIREFNAVNVENQKAGTKFFKDETDYYLALSYLRVGNYANALKLFQSIRKNPDHIYFSMVTSKLIRKIKLLNWK